MESEKIETVLKITHGDIQIAERRSGQAVHQKHDHRQERGRDPKPKYHNKFKPHRKPWTPNRVHEADVIEEEAAESQLDSQSEDSQARTGPRRKR